ncbi:DUF6503 family protein [Salinimicrobium flavum]|uniref:DUF6503 family protein n=1 Tax=Salinimicrobium flavum TaxID=1737065 RepID=A0ABW5ITK3_9FLAO
MKKLSLLLLFILMISCQSNEEELTADRIIDKAIAEAGGEKYNRSIIEFDFRKNHYTSKREDGLFVFTRTMKDSLGKFKDVLTNDGFTRHREGREVELSDSLATVYSESVNSVHYFVQLPYGLDGPAVNKELLGEDEIDGKHYYEIRVTFNQEGGGTDHEDVYMYWIEKEKFTIDYMAYRFYVNDGGIRFRVATNPRVIEGLRFVDYDNYKTDDLDTPLENLDELYEAGKLTKVSEIKNENIKVKLQ